VATDTKATEQQQPSSSRTNVVKTEVVLQPRQTLGLASTSQFQSMSSSGKRCLKKVKYDTTAAPSPSVHSSTAHRTHIKLERWIPPEALARTFKLPEPHHPNDRLVPFALGCTVEILCCALKLIEKGTSESDIVSAATIYMHTSAYIM
jgi:hypothetical protein